MDFEWEILSNPVRKVEIPKKDGKKKMLGIPSMIDLVVQQAITQLFQEQFSEKSCGFHHRQIARNTIGKVKAIKMKATNLI